MHGFYTWRLPRSLSVMNRTIKLQKWLGLSLFGKASRTDKLNRWARPPHRGNSSDYREEAVKMWSVLHTLRPPFTHLHKPSVSFLTVERPSRMSRSSAWNLRRLAADILLVLKSKLLCCGDRCAPCLDSRRSLVKMLVGGAAQTSHR